MSKSQRPAPLDLAPRGSSGLAPDESTELYGNAFLQDQLLAHIDAAMASVAASAAQAVATVTAGQAADAGQIASDQAQAMGSVDTSFDWATDQSHNDAAEARSSVTSAAETGSGEVQAAQTATGAEVEGAAASASGQVDLARSEADQGIAEHEQAQAAAVEAAGGAQGAAAASQARQAATGGGETGPAKARAAGSIGDNASANVGRIASGASSAVHDQAGQAASQVDAALGGVPSEIEGFLGETTGQLSELGAQVGGALLELSGQFADQVLAGAEQVAGSLQQGREHAHTALEAGATATLDQLDGACAEAVAAILAEAQAESAALGALRAEVEAQPGLPDTQELSAAVDQQALEFDGALRAGAEAFAGELSETTALAGQHQDTLAQEAGGAASALASGFGAELDRGQGSAEGQVSGLVAQSGQAFGETSAAAQDRLGQVADEADHQADAAVAGVGQQLVQVASTAQTQMDGEVSGVAGKVAEAAVRIDTASVEQGFWSKAWDGFLEGLLVGLLVMVGLALVEALFNPVVALVVGIVLLVIGAVMSVVQRLHDLDAAGASGWHIAAYLVVACLGGAFLDALGLVALLEGIVGIDFVAWRKLDEDERGKRFGEGLAGLLLLLLSLGMARAARAPRFDPSKIDPSKIDPSKVDPSKVPVVPEAPRTLEALRSALSEQARRGFDQTRATKTPKEFGWLTESLRKADGTFDVEKAEKDFARRALGDEEFKKRMANREAKAVADADQAMKKIDSIESETTRAGRPGGTVGDGSSEAALRQEIATGKRVLTKEGHAGKCSQAVAALRQALGQLERAREVTTDPARQAKMDDARTRGKARLDALQPAVGEWNGRAASHPQVWNADGTSKTDPGFPSNPGPLPQ
jgi:hypothetical protein